MKEPAMDDRDMNGGAAEDEDAISGECARFATVSGKTRRGCAACLSGGLGESCSEVGHGKRLRGSRRDTDHPSAGRGTGVC